MSGQNAVLRRVQTLTKHWRKFTAEPNARYLRWRLDSQAGRMVDAFIAFHGDEASDLADLFFPISIPVGEGLYWNEVYEQLVSEIEDGKKDLESLEIPVDWVPPPISAKDRKARPADAVVEMLVSYQAFYADYFEHVALVLIPESISELKQWIQCLEQPLRSAAWKDTVRFLVVDWTPSCPLSGWSDEHASQVLTQSPVLDISGLPLEILQQLKTTGPGAEFRTAFVQLSAAANGGAIQQVLNLAERAVTIAIENQWFALVAAVKMMVGATMAKHGEIKQMIEAYRAASLASQKMSTMDPGRAKVMVSTSMAEAGSRIAGAEYREARKLYRDAAMLADRAKDPNMAFEAHRMACFCSQQSEEFDDAWFHARSAISFAKNIDVQMRSRTTVPYLLTDLENLAKRPGSMVKNFDLQHECEQLLGRQYHRVMDEARKALTKIEV